MYFISTTDLKARLDRREPITIVEVQSAGSFAKAHLPGAMAFAHRRPGRR